MKTSSELFWINFILSCGVVFIGLGLIGYKDALGPGILFVLSGIHFSIAWRRGTPKKS